MRPLRLCFATALLAASSLAAQDVTVHSTSNVRFYGGLGKMMSIAARMGGKDLNDPLPGTTYLSGHKMRVESGDNASVVDVDAGRIMNIDNKNKSYTSMTFEEMGEMVRRMQDSLKQTTERSKGGAKRSDPKGDVEMKYQVSVDRTGERAKIAGHDAERLFITITMTADVTPEGEKTQEAGSLVFLHEEWISKEAAHATAMREFEVAYMKRLGRAFENQGRSLDAAFSTNPQLKDGFAALARERQKIQGAALRSTTFVAFVPANMTFDRQLALNDAASSPAAAEGEKKGGGVRGMMGKLQKMADEASRKEDRPASQMTMMTVKSEVGEISRGRVDAALFSPPAGYKEVTMRTPDN